MSKNVLAINPGGLMRWSVNQGPFNFSGAAAFIFDGDTLEALLALSTYKYLLLQSQRHLKEWRDSLTRKNGKSNIPACHYLSYGNHKISAPSPTNTATKPPKAMPISMITS